MRSIIFSAAVVLGLVAFGLTTYPAEAQQNQPPQQDCHQEVGNQPQAAGQDQSCNTVYKDPDLVQASDSERIQNLRNRSPSLPDGPFRRSDTHLDYIVVKGPLSGPTGNITPAPGDDPIDQIDKDNLDPGVVLSVAYLVENIGGGMSKVTLTDNGTGGNQILNTCPDGIMFVKSGGKQQTATAIGEIDMWYDDGADNTPCGLVFTPDHGVNEVVIFYALGPSGFFTLDDIAIACNLVNLDVDAQQNNVSHIIGRHPASGDGLPPATNLTGCFGEGASYCDFGENEGLPNACYPEAQPIVGAPAAQFSVASGPPFPPPGLAVASQVIETLSSNGSDQTTTVGGGESGGALITCCSFPQFP